MHDNIVPRALRATRHKNTKLVLFSCLQIVLIYHHLWKEGRGRGGGVRIKQKLAEKRL